MTRHPLLLSFQIEHAKEFMASMRTVKTNRPWSEHCSLQGMAEVRHFVHDRQSRSRCQPATVFRWTKTRAVRQRHMVAAGAIQKRRSRRRTRGRPPERFRAISCCRRARFSRTSYGVHGRPTQYRGREQEASPPKQILRFIACESTRSRRDSDVWRTTPVTACGEMQSDSFSLQARV